MGEFLLFGGASFAFLPVLVLLAVVVVLALRHDDDAGEERAPAIYGSFVAFVALLTLLVAPTAAVGALVGFTEDGGSSLPDRRFESMVEDGGDHDDDWRALAASVIAGGAAVAVLALHRPLLDRRSDLTGAARRVYRAYLALMSMVTVVVTVVVGAVLVYAVLRLLSPGVFGGEDRGAVGRDTLPLLALFLGAATLWRWHWGQLWGPPRADDEVSAAAAP